jgi:hypothetical protein
MKIKTDEAQPKVEGEVSKAKASPKGMGADRQPEPRQHMDGMNDGGYSKRKGSPRS